jgi:superfamily I DNA and/or RNA helicase
MLKKEKYTRAPEPEDELTYSEEVAQEQPEPVEKLTAEEESYKKRYQDIQRHIQTVRDQKDQEVAEVKKQLDEATRKQIKFPKSDEEVEAWSNRYPDVAKIVDTIARKRANEVMQEGEKRLEQVEKFEKSLQRQSAEQELLKYHPDFVDIRQDQKFHDWVSEQPSAMQDSVYKNNTDVKWAARTIDLYKADTGKRKTSNKSAAEAVGRTSTSAPKTGEKSVFSESMVQAMSDKEYEANEEAITAAIQAGSFSYDISGAAR